MKKIKIELDILLFMLMEGISLLYFFKFSFLNFIIGSILGIIFIFLMRKLNVNKIVSLFLLIISLFFLFSLTNKINSFISFNILRNYPSLIITISFLLLSFHLANKGFHTYIKSLEITSYFYLFIKLFSFILIIPNIDLQNLNSSFIDELKISYDFLFIIITYLYLHLSIKYLTNKETHILGFTISSINPIIIKVLTILLLGRTLTYLYQYPYVNYLKNIKYFDFIERMEGILSFEYLFSFFFLLSFIMLVILTIGKSILKNVQTR